MTGSFRKFYSLSSAEKRILLEAVFLLYWAKILLLIFPFRICLKWVKTDEFSDVPDINRLVQIKFALGRAGRVTFWRNVCLVQSFAARWMLRRRHFNSELSIGVKQSHGKERLIAHAWITSHGMEIVRKDGDYVVLHRF